MDTRRKIRLQENIKGRKRKQKAIMKNTSKGINIGIKFSRVGSHKGFPCGSADKESACNVGDLGLIPGLGRCPGEGKGYPLQYSGLEDSMDCIIHRATKSWT